MALYENFICHILYLFCMDTIDAFAKNLSTEGLNSFRHDLIRFFNTKVFDSTHNWDIVVKVDRKGIWIFNDLMKDAQISSEFVQISSFGIIDNQELFQHKKVLIFDDAIHHGTKIREEIDKINKLGVKSLTIAVLFANSDTIRQGGEIQYVKWDEPYVEPESVIDYEAGMAYTRENFSIKANYYYMDFSNEIVPLGTIDKDGNPIRGNAEKTIHSGIEFS